MIPEAMHLGFISDWSMWNKAFEKCGVGGQGGGGGGAGRGLMLSRERERKTLAF